MGALERLSAITKQHYFGETENGVVLSDVLMKLFKEQRHISKEKANELFKMLSYQPYRYNVKKEDLKWTRLMNIGALEYGIAKLQKLRKMNQNTPEPYKFDLMICFCD